MNSLRDLFERRKQRTRYEIKKRACGKPRLSVFRSDKHIYVQVIDDTTGRTLASSSSLSKDLRGKLKNGSSMEAAAIVGKDVAEKAIKAGIKDVVFDRGGYIYHGRVKSLADAAREAGLNF
jgi:large subunit ribosomal protein L18